jgi:hypothetical protein
MQLKTKLLSFHFSPKTITNGLILNIDAANPSCYKSGSSIAKDLTKNGRDCTLTNVGYSTIAGGSFTFGGSSSNYIKIPPTGILTDFTISIWFQSTGAPTSGSVNYNTLISYIGINRILLSTGSPYLILTQMATGSPYNYFSTNGCPFNTWNNVTYTYNSTTSTQQLYINNIKQAPQTNSGIFYNNANHYLGILDETNTAYYMKGYISTLQIYNRVLSDEEVSSNFKALKTRFGL